MSRFLRILPMLLVMLLGAQDVALAGGATTAKVRNTKLSNADIEECAKDPVQLQVKTKEKTHKIKADAAARVIEKIAADEGVDSPKIVTVLGMAFYRMDVSGDQLGLMFKFEGSSFKNQLLVIIQREFGDSFATKFADGSGATFPESDGDVDSNQQADAGDDATKQGEGLRTGDTTEGDGSGQTQGQANTPPPPVQDDPEPPAEEPVPPPQPPVGQPYAGQQLL